MNKYYFLLFLIILSFPFVSATNTTVEGVGSGEAYFESDNSFLNKAYCVINPLLCYTYFVDTRSYGTTEEVIDKQVAGTVANQPLSENELLKKRISSARERTTNMYGLMSVFWQLTINLLYSFFIFLEVYVVFWGLFILVPKLMTLSVKKMYESGVFSKWKRR